MKLTPGGWCARPRPVMELLAQARPTALDPPPGRLDQRAGLVLLQRDTERPPAGAARVGGREPRAGRRPAGRMVWGAAVTVAAGATAVALLVLTGGAAGTGEAAGPGRTAGAVPAPHHHAAALSARQILLTAAVSAARQPAVGRYWRVEDISANVMAAGPNAHPYAVEQRWSPSVSWDARSPLQRSWTFPATGYRSVPASAGAAAAWRADGSPRLPSSGGAQQGWWQTGGAVGYFGNANLTFAQFQRLPSEPARLAAAVRAAAEQQDGLARQAPGSRVPAADLPTLSQDMFGVYDQLLKLDPITPQVRAAVFRDIAALPGVRSAGPVTDPLGRAGYGIAMGQGPAGQSGLTEELLVIAPGSGLLLADEFLQVSPPAGSTPPASGAVPGLTHCPPGTSIGPKPVCQLTAAQTAKLMKIPVRLITNGRSRSWHITNGRGRGLVELGPQMELSASQIQSYDAVVSAGWTNSSPQLPPPSQRFSTVKDGKG